MCVSNNPKTQQCMTGSIYFSFTSSESLAAFREDQEGLHSDCRCLLQVPFVLQRPTSYTQYVFLLAMTEMQETKHFSMLCLYHTPWHPTGQKEVMWPRSTLMGWEMSTSCLPWGYGKGEDAIYSYWEIKNEDR